MGHFFREWEVSHNLRKVAVLFLPPAMSTTHGTNPSRFCGTLIWNQLPNLIKSSKSIIFEFKTNLKQLANIGCGCVIYRK